MKDEIINAILRKCGNFEDGKRRTFKYYRREHPSTKEFAEFLKKEWGEGGCSPAIVEGEWQDGIHYSWSTFGYINGKKCKGIKIEKYTLCPITTLEEVDIPWTEVAERTASLIDNGSFMNAKDYYSMHAAWELRQLIWVQ